LLDDLNKKLKENFGQFDDKPKFRLVWSEDQFEKRLSNVTSEGLRLQYPQMIELPKYRHYLKDRYVLERLTEVPAFQAKELATALSYEPIWVFEGMKNEPIKPNYGACKFVIETLLESTKDSIGAKYKDIEDTPEEKLKRIEEIENDLWGNETEIGDALAHKQAIIKP